MKASTLTALAFLLSMALFAQPLFAQPLFAQALFAQTRSAQPGAGHRPGAGYRPGYRFLHSGNEVANKNFYLFTVIGHSKPVTQLLAGDDTLKTLLRNRLNLIDAHAYDTTRTAESLITGFRWNSDDSAKVDRALRRLYEKKSALLDTMINTQLRPSGACERWKDSTNLGLLLHAWGLEVHGMNYILDQYGLGKKLRYPRIDSVSYDVNGGYYRAFLKTLFSVLDERKNSMRLFYQPSLAIAMELMRANDRDEPARFEPLHMGVNKAAATRAKTLAWNKYPYTAILVPGEGPELTTVAFDPIGRLRCDLAADRWRKGRAPFIIVSGGYCHPWHTSFCEAEQMKRYLVETCGLPENAVIMDPQARHTTTNFRNGVRLMIRYGFPLDKPALCVSTREQTDYIENAGFDRRNLRELGYLPYEGKKRLGPHDIAFLPVMDCLQLDPGDPLDP